MRQELNDLKSALVTPAVLVIAHGVMSEKMSKTLRTTDNEWRRVIEVSPSQWSGRYGTLLPGIRARKNQQRHGIEQAPAAYAGSDHPQAR